MARTVEAAEYSRHQGGGGAEAELIRGSDGVAYVVKFRGNPQEPTPTGGRIIANELVTGGVGALIGAPCPEVVIMNVSDEFIRTSPINYPLRGKPPGGPQFGSRYVSDSTGTTHNNPNAEHIRQFKNVEQIPSLVLLDSICKNEDRKIEHIVFHAVTGGQRFYGVDYGHCLGVARGWSTLTPDPDSTPLVCPDSVKSLVTAVTEKGWVERAIEMVEQGLTEPELDRILLEVPAAAWGIPTGEIGLVKKFILAQKNSIRRRALSHLEQFPSLRIA